ncbi:MAG: ParB N-terminal domain-containing protein [Agrobacterium cavarae]
MVIEYGKVEDVRPAEFQAHPLADLLPMMDDDAFDDFMQDVKIHGQREPIIIYENKILDGRNRYKACQMLGISPRFKDFNGNDPIAFVVSLNLKRRHLTESQRAMFAGKLANLGKGNLSKSANLPISPVSQPEAAKMLNVSERSVRTAKQVQKSGAPELIQAVEKGEISVSAAALFAKEPIEVQQEVISKAEEKQLEKALKQYQHAKVEHEKASKLKPAPPLTDEEIAERERIFGTREVRSVLMDIITAGEATAKMPPPEVVADSVPAAMENLITENINAMREVSKWFDGFVTAWQTKECAR